VKKFNKEINGLEFYLGNEGQDSDVVLQVIDRLRNNLRYAESTEYTQNQLREICFSENDPLAVEGADDLPGLMLEEVREIQYGIINWYAKDE